MKNSTICLLLFVLFFSACAEKDQKETVQNDDPMASDQTEKPIADAKLPDFPWYDETKSFEERAALIVKELTLDEKILLMTHDAKGIERLGIPSYNWWSEALHGIARNGRATVFPQAIGLAATFDQNLALEVATAISDEARAKFNVSIANENRAKYAGLTFWTPNINIFRDARWGRGQETYGEDPYLTSRMGVNFVKGLQGDNDKYLKSAACAKHYAVHSGPEELRHEFDAKASMKDMHETYLPAFEVLVKEGKVEGIMGAYNRVNGELANASPFLLEEKLRKSWGFDGYIVSDCWAISDFHLYHKVSSSPQESAAMALNMGVDVNCGDTYSHLKKAIEEGLTTEKQLDNVLTHQLLTRFKLGLFDPKSSNPYNAIPTDVVDSKKHRDLARKVAQKSIVLLKNKNNILPLKKDIKTLYVAGPHAASEEVLLGNYYGLSSNTATILDGIVNKVSVGTTINYKQGLLGYRDNVNPIDWSTGEIAKADAGILVMGINGLWEGEEGESIASPSKGDRTFIKLPQNQIDYIKKVKNKDTGNPLILVLTGGSPIALPEIYDLVDAILFVWYPGEEGGNAVGDIIFGDAVPSGKLPITFPYSVKDLPPFEDYSMKNRTYKYAEKEPQFPFGFGLSYTTFNYSNLNVSPSQSKVKVSVTLKNTGELKADEVVQVYVSSPKAGKGDPFSSLVAFKRITLDKGGESVVEFELDKKAFISYDAQGNGSILPGDYTIKVGAVSPGKRGESLGVQQLLNKTVEVSSIML